MSLSPLSVLSGPEGGGGTDPPVQADATDDGREETIPLRPHHSVQQQPREPQVQMHSYCPV